jgi:multiple sugar transport system permease protein
MASELAGKSGARTQGRLIGVRGRRVREVALGYALLAPACLLLLVFEFFPIVYGFYISTCDWRLSCTKQIGLDNYVRALGDSDVWNALGVTATYSALAVPIQLALSLLIAYLLFQNIRGKQTLRVLYFMPYITSTVASASVWAYLYSPEKGFINTALKGVGLAPLRWLQEPRGVFQVIGANLGIDIPPGVGGPSLALMALIVYTTWVFVGFDTTIFLAGLGNIPRELYDAARVDGAEGWRLFRSITFPLLSPTTFFLVILTVIGTFKAFNHIFVMTQGGPGDSTTTASIFIFKQLFEFNRYGYSAALSFLLFFAILILTVFQNQFAGKRVVYD